MEKSKYTLVRKSYIKYSDFNIHTSFDMKKRNSGVIKFFDPNIIQNVIEKALKNRFKKLFDLIIAISEDDNPDGLLLCLDETEKFKQEAKNKYIRFLDNKRQNLLKKKFELIEKELKDKLIMYSMTSKQIKNLQEESLQEEEVRHHSR